VIVAGATAPSYTTLAVTPQTPSIDVGARVTLAVTALDQFGNPMTGLGVATFATSNAAIATVDAKGAVTGVAGGTATITASLTIGSVTHTASATVTVVAPQANAATVETPSLTFSPQSVTIGVGGTVTWRFGGSTHNVTFGALKPTGGNIPDTSPGNAVSRAFTTAGTYDYQCTRHNGMTGRVVVQAADPGTGPGAGTGTLASVSATPASVVLAPNGTARIVVTPRDASGAPLALAATPTFVSSDTRVATVSGGVVTAVATGEATITVSITSDGVTRTTTVAITVAAPAATIGTSASQFTPQEVSVRVGQTVLFQFSGASHNVTFKDLRPAEGNIPDSAPGTSATRTFSAAGDYDFYCTWHSGMKGRIRVQ
jgi:plastocyanin